MSTSSQNLIQFAIEHHLENIWVLPLNIADSEKKIIKKFWKKKFGKKILERSFDKKNVGKLNYKTKLFITIIYSNIDKCHTIFTLLAPYDKTGRKTGSNENVCGIWFKIGSVARSHWTQGMWRFERSREKRYIMACELSVTFNTTRMSRVVYISCSLVVRCWIHWC